MDMGEALLCALVLVRAWCGFDLFSYVLACRGGLLVSKFCLQIGQMSCSVVSHIIMLREASKVVETEYIVEFE